MKSFRNIKSYLVLLAAMAISVACEDMIEVEPRQSIDANTALNNPDNIKAALNSPYARLRSVNSYGRNLIALPEVLADNGTATNNSGRLVNEGLNQLYSHFTHWENSYYAINEINLILEALESPSVSPPLTQAQKNSYEGQARFLRALYYFDLARAYAYDPGAVVPERDKGGVPISTTGFKDYQAAMDFMPARSPVADVYALIYSDLQRSIEITGNSGGPVYATAAAAQALLSRVALYNKDYATVVAQATSALASSVGRLTVGGDYVDNWRKDSHAESMFEVKFAVAGENIGVNESLQATFSTIRSLSNLRNPDGTLNITGNTGGWGDLVPSATLRTLLGISAVGASANMTIERGDDVRGQLYEIGPGRGSGPKIEMTKFMGKTGTLYMDNVPVIRRAELLLNRAEAYATQGSPVFDEALALADLNTLLEARGLTEVNLTGAALYDAIIEQRRIELAFEGHRWFDLKRRGQNIPKAPVIEFTDVRILANIPQREVDGNNNLDQNDGY